MKRFRITATALHGMKRFRITAIALHGMKRFRIAATALHGMKRFRITATALHGMEEIPHHGYRLARNENIARFIKKIMHFIFVFFKKTPLFVGIKALNTNCP
jgi:hypothetical protein